MDIRNLEKNWDKLGENDPLWAILTDPVKKGNKWDINEFFSTGTEEINLVIKHLKGLPAEFSCKKALDFGCGVGRLTQALAGYFEEVCGIDIAPSMIEAARQFNRYPNKCKYYLNKADNLNLFKSDTFDFIYSNIVLQHMKSRYSKSYIKEFMRILASKGVLVFHMPCLCIGKIERIKQVIQNYFPFLYELLVKLKYGGNYSVMEMHAIKKDEMVKFLEGIGGKILDIKAYQSARKHWLNCQYFVSKE